VAAGERFVAAARRAGLQCATMVSGLPGRFHARGIAAFSNGVVRGRKPTDDASVRVQILARALSCGPVNRNVIAVGVSFWHRPDVDEESIKVGDRSRAIPMAIHLGPMGLQRQAGDRPEL
jgi:hypothetical protein